MEQEKLLEIINNHQKWLATRYTLSVEGQRADLSHTDLIGVDLSGADLSEANLRDANLRDANLKDVCLRGANLVNANMRGARLNGALLNSADMRRADLFGANLAGAYLSDTNLRGAYLSGANLRNVKSTSSTAFYAICCPEEGAFIGYKKANHKIVKLEICSDAKRSSATSRKCRCNKAKVLSITNLDGTDSHLTEIASDYDKNFIYKIGEVVEVENFDEDRWIECTAGIHFFITRDEAVNY